MIIRFVKRGCCHDAGCVVAEIDSTDRRQVAEWLIDTCAYQMGDGCYAHVIESAADAAEIYGDEVPDGLTAALARADGGGVLESVNGCLPKYLPLPAKDTDAYYRAIIADLTGCDWGDCDVQVD